MRVGKVSETYFNQFAGAQSLVTMGAVHHEAQAPIQPNHWSQCQCGPGFVNFASPQYVASLWGGGWFLNTMHYGGSH